MWPFIVVLKLLLNLICVILLSVDGSVACMKTIVIEKHLINRGCIFLSFSEYCKTWYHLLVAKLLYCNPAIKSFDLQYHTQVSKLNMYWCHISILIGYKHAAW